MMFMLHRYSVIFAFYFYEHNKTGEFFQFPHPQFFYLPQQILSTRCDKLAIAKYSATLVNIRWTID
jgi:hypothetical protein